jgi:hypothetical protein
MIHLFPMNYSWTEGGSDVTRTATATTALHIRWKHDNNDADDLNNETFLHNMLDRLSALKDQPSAPHPAEYVDPEGLQDYEDSVHSDHSALFHGFDSVNDEDFHGFDSNHDSDSYYDTERPMFPRDDPDPDSPTTDADDESDHVPMHCPNCQLDCPCKLHSCKRLHGSDRAAPSKRHKGKLVRRQLHVPLDRSNSDLSRRGKICTYSDKEEDDRKHIKLNLRPQSNQKNPSRVINNNRHTR